MAGIYAAEEARRAPADQLTLHEEWAQVDYEVYNQIHRQLKRQAAPVGRAAPGGAQASLGDLPRGGPQAAEAPPVESTLDSLLASIRAYHERQAGAP